MKKLAVTILILILCTLTGCWDSRELDSLALVMAVGVDKSADMDGFTVTVQIAKPSSVAGGKQGSKAGDEKPVWTAEAEGKTIFEAIRNLSKFSSRRIMWAHNNIVIIGESLAREDITPVVDFFTHNPELRMKTWVAVSHGDAKQYIAAKTGMENIPAMSEANLFDLFALSGESVRTDMTRLFREYKSESIQPLVSTLDMRQRLLPTGGEQEHGGQQQVVLEGGAVFKEERMIGFVTPEEARGLGLENKEIKSFVVAVPGPGNEKKFISIEVSGVKVKINSTIAGNIPSMEIKVSCSGNITEQDYPANIPMQEFKSTMEERASALISDEIRRGVEKVQKEYRSDVLGFGRMTHIQHRREWNAGLKDEWEEIYPQIQVRVDTKVRLNTSELFQKTMDLEKIRAKGGK